MLEAYSIRILKSSLYNLLVDAFRSGDNIQRKWIQSLSSPKNGDDNEVPIPSLRCTMEANGSAYHPVDIRHHGLQ